MAQGFASAFRSFWHTMTSSDRHASHNSPYRTGQHVPLPQSHHAQLTSVATNATDSRTDLSSSSAIDLTRSPTAPYSPGMKSALQRSQSEENGLAKSPSGEIMMQNFSEGLPPPPPVTHSWKRIDRWTEDNYEELLDNLGEGCTQNDINELEHALDCTLPMEVRESLQVHDGQERGGLPTGIIFGLMLLDCEEIVHEWRNWRTVSQEFLTQQVLPTPQVPIKAFACSSISAAQLPPQGGSNLAWREQLLARQDSQPSDAIKKAYAHPAWIPLARDWGGNNIAVDLSPGSTGKWGQIIIMGRDYDCKYVVARSWAAFLATMADDLNSKAFVDEDTGELKLRQFKDVEPSYLNILRWRADQKFGRKPPRRRTNSELTINPSLPSPPRGSPYGSPTATDSDRGRSPNRIQKQNKINAASPRNHVSSPLARVSEEIPPAMKVNTNAQSPKQRGSTTHKFVSVDIPTALNPGSSVPTKAEKLVPVDTPLDTLFSEREKVFRKSSLGGNNKENIPANGAIVNSVNGKGLSHQQDENDEMKTIEI